MEKLIFHVDGNSVSGSLMEELIVRAWLKLLEEDDDLKESTMR